MPLNVKVLRIFGPVLIFTGLSGFFTPSRLTLMSGAAPYNLFHIVFGVIGSILAWYALNERGSRLFNLGFGLIDLYQAVASHFSWFPAAYFRWTRADDVLHIVLGAALTLVGFRFYVGRYSISSR